VVDQLRDLKRTLQVPLLVEAGAVDRTFPLRDRYRQEMNCQVVHDSIHTRPGWTLTYVFSAAGSIIGFGSIAVGGPWQDKPTVLEFYLAPETRSRAFECFEELLAVTGAKWMEVQSNDLLATTLLHTYGRDIVAESIVFRDCVTTSLTANGATLGLLTPAEETQSCIAERAGGPKWRLEVEGEPAGNGGILFHYNIPYGDIYMEIDEPYRRRGLGSYLVQQLKRQAYELGAIPAARCNPANVASRRTLQKAGFEPYAAILTGSL
jgi:GNAT superfamily N-acetyltransferase